MIHVALDTNVWVYETRLLRSPTGAAVLFAVDQMDARLVVPEVVEAEVRTHAVRLGTEANDKIRDAYGTVAALMGRRDDYRVPDPDEYRKAIDQRFSELDDRLVRVPFTFDHARAALEMVFSETPPNGPKNQQFKDSAIWRALLDIAESGPVHFITNDKGFFESRDVRAGLAMDLRKQLEEVDREIDAHYGAVSFLAATRKEIPEIDSEQVAAAIDRLARATIESNAESKGVFVGDMIASEISLYLTEKTGILAADFELSYMAGLSDGSLGRLDVEGTCSYLAKQDRADDLRLERITGFDEDGSRVPGLGATYVYVDSVVIGRKKIPYTFRKPLE